MRIPAALCLAGAVPSQIWAQEQPTLEFLGNVGFRVEDIANENFASTSTVADDNYRMRFRIRTRFGARYRPSEIVTTGFRLTTGAADFPSSEWSSLNDLFKRDVLRLDRAFVRVQPLRQIELRFGLDDNAAFKTSEMVWDDDVSPGGVTRSSASGRCG